MTEFSSFKIVQLTLTSTIGAAIVFAPNILLKAGLTPYVSLIILLAVGLLSLVQALCYAELNRIVPGGGGDATYLKKAFGPKLAFVYNVFSVCAVIPACSAFGLSKTATALSMTGSLEKFLLVLISLLIILAPSRVSSFIFQAFFYIKIAGICTIAVLILFLLCLSDGGCLINTPTASTSISWMAMIKAFVNCTFFFSGYNTCNYLEMSAPLFVPYTVSAVLTTIIYMFFTAGQYAVFSWEEIVNSDTPLLLIRIPLSKLIQPSKIASISLYSKRFIEFVLYFGPVLSCHAVFNGIFSTHLTKDPIASFLSYVIYGFLVYAICIVETADSILNSTSILMSLFYCLTFLALFRLRNQIKNPISALVPFVALLISGITTTIDIYERASAFFDLSKFTL